MASGNGRPDDAGSTHPRNGGTVVVVTGAAVVGAAVVDAAGAAVSPSGAVSSTTRVQA